MNEQHYYTRSDVLRIIRKSSKTLTAWLRDKRFPAPAVATTREAQQWSVDQLRQAGYDIPAQSSNQSAKS